MKKVVALALALVLALSLGVSVFALTPVTLTKASADYASEKETLETLWGRNDEYVAPAEGGTFYFELGGLPENNESYTYEFDVDAFEVEVTGGLEAEVVAYDPETMFDGEATYKITVDRKIGQDILLTNTNAVNNFVKAKFGQTDYNIDSVIEDVIAKYEGGAKKKDYARYDFKNYDYVEAIVEELTDSFNKKDGVKFYTYKISGTADDTYLLKLTVPENYGVAYTEGTFEVKAKYNEYEGKKFKSSKEIEYEGTVYTDVVIFTYDDVNDAYKKQVSLNVGQMGYSDYRTQGKYGATMTGTPKPNATVVCTTAFRALRENGYSLDITLGEQWHDWKNPGSIEVDIKEIAETQKGVNFAGYELAKYNKEGRKLTGWFDGKYYDLDRVNLNDKDTDVAYLAFGFYGKQLIASDFTITYDLEMDAVELRETFGQALEEEDIITYYIVKDGKVLDTFVIDYLDTDQAFKDVKLEIAGKAGDTLGEYRIQLTAPAGAEGEENPNTGAESVVGVVAALAVVSLASAAAISLKK